MGSSILLDENHINRTLISNLQMKSLVFLPSVHISKFEFYFQ